jgi:glycosyltransferase involved in cell wall biosynthesis
VNILLLTKFPPTQGGEASKSYWLVRGLAERGHRIHVVTNANETDRAFLVPDAGAPQDHLPSNVSVHFLSPEVEFHVPSHRAYCERLANAALHIAATESVDVVEAAHLTPYGVAALIVKACTGLPFVQRHGGSDVGYLWKSDNFGTLITRVMQAADRLAINPGLARDFVTAGVPPERLTAFRYFVDPATFTPDGPRADLELPDEPVILFSGKVTPGKRLVPLLSALRDLDRPFTLLLLPVALRLDVVRELVERFGPASRTVVMAPRPPWEMPALLRSASVVCCLETGFTTPDHWPMFPREILATGTCLVLSREQYERRALSEATDGVHFVVADPDDPAHLRATLERVLDDADLRRRVAANALALSRDTEDHELMLDDAERTYDAAVQHARSYA